ncbi:MAG: malectin domain-containing carbohydrate-binding protein, partial [Terracidiphilus sp.]
TSIVSINAGGAAVSNSGGGDNSFVADEDYSGGTTYSVTNTITIPASIATTAAPSAVYQTAREGATTYTIPGLTAGTSYTVRLHFAELYFSAAGDREFNVAINGTTVLTNFDIYKTAGAAYTAVVENFTATANSSGDIVIAFTNGAVNQPEFEGIEVLGSATSGTSTVSINAGGAAVSNSGGGDNSFVADEDYTGGTTYAVTNAITIPASISSTAAPMAVYQSARQGTVTYTIAGLTAGSSHTVRLHFAELYFSAAGDRVFDVAINGTAVLTNFDIYKTAGANPVRTTRLWWRISRPPPTAAGRS